MNKFFLLENGFTELRGKQGFFCSPEISIITPQLYIINLDFANASLFDWSIIPYRWMKINASFAINDSPYNDNMNCNTFSVQYEEENSGQINSACAEHSFFVTSSWTNILYVTFVNTTNTPNGAVVNYEQICDFDFQLDSGFVFSPEHPANVPEDILPLDFCVYTIRSESNNLVAVVIEFDISTIVNYNFDANLEAKTITIGSSGSSLVSNYSVYYFSEFTLQTDLPNNGNETQPFGLQYRFIASSTDQTYPRETTIEWSNRVNQFRSSSLSSPFFVQFEIKSRDVGFMGQLMRHSFESDDSEFYFEDIK